MQTQIEEDPLTKMPTVGIVGTGKIIRESVGAMRQTGWNVAAVWGRSHDKACAIAEELSIEKVYATYDELLTSGVDFVYIGLTNNVHYEFAMKALEMGVNVLVEKPFCSTLEQAAALASKAREKGLYLFETISNIHLPSWQVVREQLPKIGDIKLFQADFSQYSSRYKEYLSGVIGSAFDPECDGGTLRDLNIYNLHLAVDLFGLPEEAIFRATRGHNGIDTSGVALLRYPTMLALCVGAKDSNNSSGVTIQGEKGWIRIDGMPNLLSSVDVHLLGGESHHYAPNRYEHRLCHQFEHYRTIFERGDVEAMNRDLDHTLDVMTVLDRLVADSAS